MRDLSLFRGDTNNVERRLAVVRYFQPPALSRLELPIDVTEQLGSYQGGFAPSSCVVRQILAAGIVTTNIVDVEKVSWHLKGNAEKTTKFPLNRLKRPDRGGFKMLILKQGRVI